MVQAQAAADPAAAAPTADPIVTTDADPSEGQAVVEAEGQAGAVVEGAVEEAPKPLSLADVPEADLLAHLRERKNADGLSVEDRLRKSERDRYEASRRLEAGKVESVTRRTQRFLERHGVDPSEATPEELGELNALSHYANLDALGNIGKAWAQATAEEFGAQDSVLLQEALARYADDPTGIDDLASKTWIAARDAVRTRTLAEASLSDVPEGSKLRADINAEAQRLADVELQARELAARQKDSPPSAPVGAPSASQEERYRSMNAGEVSLLPPAEYEAWMTWRAAQPSGARR
jgi:hypothetical protein